MSLLKGLTPQTADKDISVIIPCFNTSAEYIKEAIDSIKKYKGHYSYNIIIVNDGSTHEATLQFLNNIDDILITIITQNNKGLAGAKNTGVRHTASEYVLFLDSDDRVKPEYIELGLNVLKADNTIAVVYSNAEAFGDSSRQNFKALPFDIASLLLQNHVPSCVVMRKKAWEDTGGFDENLRKYEDWECWVSVYKAGWKFRLIDKPMFEYRIHQHSLLGKSGEKDFKQAVAYIYKKHWDLVYQVFHQLYATSIIYKNDMKKPLRSFVKFSAKKLKL